MEPAKPKTKSLQKQNTKLEKELYKIELTHENKQYILTILKKENNILFIFDDKYKILPEYYMTSLNYESFSSLGKSFRLCDDIKEVENAIIFYMDNIIQNEKGFKLKVNSKSNEIIELIVEINIINQNLKSVIQLNKIEKNINEKYNEVKKLLELYMEKYGTEILNQNYNNIHIYNNEETDSINKEELDLINEGLKKNLNKKIKKMKLLYKASRDGDSAENFHKNCDNTANTLTIVKTTKNKKFGGFTTQKWNGSDGYKSDTNAFIFSFDNKEIYYNSINSCSICVYNDYGPIFGGGNDFCIFSGCLNNNDSYDNSPHSYDTKGKKYALNGDRNFKVSDYEVYELILS